MNITWLIITAIVALILYTYGCRAYRFYLYYQRINMIPGPEYRIPLLGFICEFMALKAEDRLQWYIDTCNKYKDGYIKLWVGPKATVHISKPEHVEVILRSTAQITKAQTYDLIMQWLGLGLLTSTGSQWHHDRKRITPSFHFSILEDFAEVMIDKAAILNKCFEQEIKKHGNKPFEIFELTVNCALDVICVGTAYAMANNFLMVRYLETAMGVNVHAQEEPKGDYIKAVQTLTHGIIYRTIRPWLRPDWIFYRVRAGKAFRKAVNTSHELCTRVIQRKQYERKIARLEGKISEVNGATEEFGKRKRKAFMDLLLEANEEEQNPMSTEELRDHVNTLMFAGHDTTGALISWTLFSVGNDAEVQRKVHEELDTVLGNADDETTLKLLPKLKYLERVIKEALRLYPSAPVISRRLIDDMQIGDYNLPKGVSLEIKIYQLHRDPKVWPDPLRFDPDRFLPENAKGRHPYAFIPFSAGPRNCIGQKYAILEAKVILAQILRKFSVKSVDTHLSIKKHSEIILKPVEGIFVHMTKRS